MMHGKLSAGSVKSCIVRPRAFYSGGLVRIGTQLCGEEADCVAFNK